MIHPILALFETGLCGPACTGWGALWNCSPLLFVSSAVLLLSTRFKIPISGASVPNLLHPQLKWTQLPQFWWSCASSGVPRQPGEHTALNPAKRLRSVIVGSDEDWGTIWVTGFPYYCMGCHHPQSDTGKSQQIHQAGYFLDHME